MPELTEPQTLRRGPQVTQLRAHASRTVNLGKYNSILLGAALEANADPSMTVSEQVAFLTSFVTNKVNELADSEVVQAMKAKDA
jgi:hypothetical protein